MDLVKIWSGDWYYFNPLSDNDDDSNGHTVEMTTSNESQPGMTPGQVVYMLEERIRAYSVAISADL